MKFRVVDQDVKSLVTLSVYFNNTIIFTISPEYINNANYSTIQSAVDLATHRGEVFVNTGVDTQPINQSRAYYHSAFAQNPFFGYLAPAFGIDIAKSTEHFSLTI